MAWKDTGLVEGRKQSIKDWLEGGRRDLAGLGRTYGISRKTGHKWGQRFWPPGGVSEPVKHAPELHGARSGGDGASAPPGAAWRPSKPPWNVLECNPSGLSNNPHASRRKGFAPVLPSHLHWDSGCIGAHAQEPEILITPN